MRRLGCIQQDVLVSLRSHGSWSRRAHCSWVWDTPSNTQRIMDSLVVAGHATLSKGVYRPVTSAPKNAVILSDGCVVDGDDPESMLKIQHSVLLRLSKELDALKMRNTFVKAQKMIADANMLGLEVADRLAEGSD